MTAFNPTHPCWRVTYRSFSGPMTAIVRGYPGQARPILPSGTELLTCEPVGPDAPVIEPPPEPVVAVAEDCATCRGDGVIPRSQLVDRPCHACGGTGKAAPARAGRFAMEP